MRRARTLSGALAAAAAGKSSPAAASSPARRWRRGRGRPPAVGRGMRTGGT